MSDLIFWWTGWAIWAALSALVACGAGIACVLAVIKAYRATLRWDRVWALCNANLEWMNAFRYAAHEAGMTQEELNKLTQLQIRLKFRLSTLSTAPLRRLECSEWYELNNLTYGQIVSCGNADIPEAVAYQMRTDIGELIDIRADGRLTHNPAICVLTVTKRRPDPKDVARQERAVSGEAGKEVREALATQRPL